jgi:hypothetical protein
MRQLVAVLGLATVAVALLAQEGAAPPAPAQGTNAAKQAEKPPDPHLERLRNRLTPEFPAWSPEQIFERCAEFLATVNDKDRCRIRFFSLAEVPRQLLPAATSALFKGCNDAARTPITYLPRPVPNTDNRIYWIDLCWFNWSPQVWENISAEDPYYREPIIPSAAKGLNYLRHETRANPVVRGDWWLWYVFDNGEFINAKGAEIFNPKAFYYQLLYANATFDRVVEKKVKEKKVVNYRYTDGSVRPHEEEVEVVKKVKTKVKGEAPRTAAEFESAWLVEFDHLKEFPTDKGGLIDQGMSGVAYNNRIVWRVRSKIGIYWRTFDVFRTAGDQDFVQNPFPLKFDAGEHIFQDERGAQYYFLSDGQGKGVDFANPFLVKGDPSGPHNTVLLTPRSCIHCHDVGILGYRNEMPLLLREGLKLYAYDAGRMERINQFHLQEQKMRKLIQQDQENYAEFVRECTGLTPQESVQSFQRIRAWYNKPVTLDQAARELGTDAQELSDALAYGPGTPDYPEGSTKGRLGRLALSGVPVPRHTWERGGFQESGLLLLERRKSGKMRPDK